jgi:hypothetical protein
MHLTEDELSKVAPPDVTKIAEKIKSTPLHEIAEGSIYSIFLTAKDQDLVTFIEALDKRASVKANVGKHELVQKAMDCFRDVVNRACENGALKDPEVLASLDKTARTLGLATPKKGNLCEYYSTQLNIIDKLVFFASTTNSNSGFWGKLGVKIVSGIKGLFSGLWQMTTFIGDTFKELAKKGWPLAAAAAAALGTTAAVCYNNPGYCLEIFTSAWEALCRNATQTHHKAFCELINSFRCRLIVGSAGVAGRALGAVVGNQAKEVAKAGLLRYGASALSMAGSMLQTGAGGAATLLGGVTVSSVAIPLGIIIATYATYSIAAPVGSAIFRTAAVVNHGCGQKENQNAITGLLNRILGN